MQAASDQFLILGTDQADNFPSRDGNGVILAGGGHDDIWTGYGAQFVDGGAGDDGFWLGPGDHTVEGGTGNDFISGNTGAELLMGGDGHDVIWAGTGAQTVLGGDGNDQIGGSNGPQLLSGGDGNDTVTCGSGTQTVFGGAGADIIYTQDWLSDQSPSRHLVFGDEGNDRIVASRATDTVFGGAGDDTIMGAYTPSGAQAQFLDGGDGNDRFYAGQANATLTGGAGRDSYIFYNNIFNDDEVRQITITDFQAGQDTIRLQVYEWAPAYGPPSLPTVTAAPGPRGDAVLHLGHGATVTLLGVPAHQVATHLPAYVKIL